ncbi:MAG: hypothetical protein JO356_04985 [Acidobacteria bacterium]|nr:hypothetical protein [Acidobacteriota bacterium]
MSTSFQPAEWDYQFFQSFPMATTPLGSLQPQHVRLQGVSKAIPQISQGSWDFTMLDAITQPVLGVGDHSPEFQVAVAPPFMYDAQRNLSVPQFATYAQNLVRYYNASGFTSGDGVFHQSPSLQSQNPQRITWWGIYNEPNINNMGNPSVYTSLYNTVVPAMQQIDRGIKFVGVELSGGYNNWEQIYFSSFVQNVTAQVDVVADHFYSTCNQKDSDQQVFNTVPGFGNDVRTIYSLLSLNPRLANVPVWITENNVNADFSNNGMSACNPGQVFVTDRRGSSAFFAAWRPYVFSQLAKAGARALYHWDFAADAQYGELDASSGQPQLSYWVDFWLRNMFPAGSGQQWLQSVNSDAAEIEVLPVLNSDGSLVVMVANHAVRAPNDNNGSGLNAQISLDVSSAGSFTSASVLTIDAHTNASSGPNSVPISPHSPITIELNGYGVAFVSAK